MSPEVKFSYQRPKKLTLFWPFCASRQCALGARLRRGLRSRRARLSPLCPAHYGGRSRGPYTSEYKSHFQWPLVSLMDFVSYFLALRPAPFFLRGDALKFFARATTHICLKYRFLRAWCYAFILSFAFVLGFASPSHASDIYTCPEEPKSIAILGDSLADGLWGSLWRGWQACETVSLHRLTSVSDGLARSSAEKWADRLAEVGPVDAVVIQLGGNDLRRIRAEGKSYRYGTDDWKRIYAQRVKLLAEEAQAQAGAVFWIGLPIVGDAAINRDYRTLSNLYSSALDCGSWWKCRNYRLTYIDTYEPTQFGSGKYVRSVTIDGRAYTLRAPDQIHFTERGYDSVVATFIDVLIGALSS